MNYTVPISITDYTKKEIDSNIKAHDYGKHALSFLCDDIVYEYAILKFKRPDGEVIPYKLYERKFVLEGAEIDLAGYIDAEISFYDMEGRITSNTFSFSVQNDINADDGLDDDPQKPILDQLINDITKAEKQRNISEKQRQTNEELRDEKIKNLENNLDTSIKQAILDSWEVKV